MIGLRRVAPYRQGNPIPRTAKGQEYPPLQCENTKIVAPWSFGGVCAVLFWRAFLFRVLRGETSVYAGARRHVRRASTVWRGIMGAPVRESNDSEPSKNEPLKSEPLKTESLKIESLKLKPESLKPGSLKPESLKPESLKNESSKNQPLRYEPKNVRAALSSRPTQAPEPPWKRKALRG